MSTTIDNRVLEMRFDNKQFESGVATSMSTLDKLKQKLNLSGASKGLENIGSAAKKVDFSGMSNGIETVSAKFSALQVMGVTALANITNSAVNAGKRIVSALTIDPVKTGFQEYETQINSVQTILANTQHQGTSLQQVNRALDELNTYADKTIYNFTEMTRNIGTFTAAGVDLNTSVNSIKGIANLAAVSGSTSQQASSAMYQLSQALAAGKVSLMDWNSVVNAGMGGKVFQDALVRTSELLGTGAKGAIDMYGSFRESLTKGEWLTTEVLTETLKQFAGAYSEADLIAQGFTEEQAKEIAQMARNAEGAATEVKTFSQLWDTLKESVQSGWTQSWEIIVGDFGEAKELLTEISRTIGNIIGKSAEARNGLLSEGLSTGWKQLLDQGISDEAGYIEAIQNVARKNGDAFDKMIADSESFSDALKTGLKDGTVTSQTLSEAVFELQGKMSSMSEEELKAAGYSSEMVKQIEALCSGLKDGSTSMDEFTDKILKPSGRENLIEALWNSFKGLMSVVAPIKEAFREIFPAYTGEQLYSLIERIRAFTEGLMISGENAGKIKRIFKGLFSLLDIGRKAITAVMKSLFNLSESDGISSLATLLLDAAASIGDFFTSLNEGFNTGGLTGMLSKLASGISNVLESTTDGVRSFGDLFSSIGNIICKVAGKIWDVIKTVFGWIFDNVSGGDIFAGLAGGGIFLLATKIGGAFDKVRDAVNKVLDIFKGDKVSSIKENFCNILDSMHGALQSFTTGIKATTLISIAIAIGILTASVSKLSELKGTDIAKSLFTISAMLTLLCLGFKSLTKSISKFDSKGVVKSGIALILMAKAIDILADAMTKISKLSLKEIGKGLIGIGGGLLELSGAIKFIGGIKVPFSTSIAILALAKSCEILGDAMQKFSDMSWDEIARGLVGMGGALSELVAAISILGQTEGFRSLLGSAGILIVVQTLEKMSKGLKSFAEMSWDEIKRGLAAMGAALGELTVTLGITSKIAGFSSIFGAGAIWIVVQGLDDLANALKNFAEMSWDEIGHGLTAMGGALGEVGLITGALGKLASFSSIFGAGAIWVVIQGLSDLASSFESFSKMSWDEIGRGLAAMGGALGEVGLVSGALGKLAGLSGIFGSGTILIAVQGLDDLANSLKKFTKMSWDEIGRGLAAMGGALLEVSGISGALGALAGLAGIVGGASIWVAVQGLGDLGDALNKFGEMSWDEIGRGLAAMGGALGELALGGFLNTLSIIGSFSISKVAEPLGVLADSVKKWTGITVPEGLGLQLAFLADGVTAFTFSGFGASAISEVAGPLGVLADSVIKWTKVIVPEGLPDQLSYLASGITAFTFSGFGASAISEVAGPLGILADSVRKWTGLIIPRGLEEGLTHISNGVKSFTWAFMGGWSIGTIVEPLGSLPESIRKWAGISVPSDIESDLIAISNGIKSFTFAFMGSFSISTLTGSLNKLADSAKKWSGVTIDQSVEEGLKHISNGIKSFTFAFVGSWTISDLSKSLGTLVDAAVNLNNIPSDAEDRLKQISSGVKSFNDIGDISSTADDITSIASASTKLSSVNFSSINSGLHGFTNALKKLSGTDLSGSNSLKKVGAIIVSAAQSMRRAMSTFIPVGSSIADAITKGFKLKESSFKSTASHMISSTLKAVTSKAESFHQAGSVLGSRFATGLKTQSVKAKISIVSAVNSVASAIRGYWNSFYSAGTYLGSGLVSGINSKKTSAYNAGYALGQAAVKGEKDGQKSNSPSKLTMQAGKWLGEGLVIGIERMGSKVYSAGNELGDYAAKSMSNAISKVSDFVSSGMDVQPTIRPVLDLSDVRSGANAINSMFNQGRSVGVMTNIAAISSMMNGRNQNGSNYELVSAINKLRKDLGNVGNTSYNINGITYDDGSNISEAVRLLVRAAKVERRV